VINWIKFQQSALNQQLAQNQQYFEFQ